MPSEVYIEHYQRVQSRKFMFRGWSLSERIGKLLIDTGDGKEIRPQKALVRALKEGDVDAAVHIALHLVPSFVEPFDVWDRPVQASGEIVIGPLGIERRLTARG